MESEDPRHKWAHHEAGHAVQAHRNGLGVDAASIAPPVVSSTRQRELEAEGINLVDPPPLDDRLTEFYWNDIEVRVAGPLAQFRWSLESRGADLSQANPKTVHLWLFGGASNEEHIGDQQVVEHECEILRRSNSLKTKEYVEYVKEKVWRETIMDVAGWEAIRRVAEGLLAKSTLTGEECVALINRASPTAA